MSQKISILKLQSVVFPLCSKWGIAVMHGIINFTMFPMWQSSNIYMHAYVFIYTK